MFTFANYVSVSIGSAACLVCLFVCRTNFEHKAIQMNTALSLEIVFTGRFL